jgi:UDP-N-acetylmuramoylalanine--D-glutamate ligase
MGVDDQTIANGLREFKGVKHRIENVGIIDGVTYFDDSKGTNVASTISAIDCMTRPTVLILGGSEKGENYDALFEKIKEGVIKHVFITGASRFNMLESAGRVGVGNITITSDFNNAVTFAKFYAKEGENVLLSPACASFDQFTSYEERGNAFRNLIGVKSE